MIQSTFPDDRPKLSHIMPATVPLRARWRLVEAAFAADAMPGSLAALVPLAGVAAYGVTMHLAWVIWALLNVVAVATRVRLAASFETRSTVLAPEIWLVRQRAGAWAQSALLGLGGAAAILSGSLPASIMVLTAVAFITAAHSAGATLGVTARGQALLALCPTILAGVIAAHPWTLSLAAMGILELASCIMMARRAAAQTMEASTAVVTKEDAATAGPTAAPNAVEDFQRLLGRDQATGLPNRHGFMHILAGESRRAHDAAMPLSLILISLDGLPESEVLAEPSTRQAQLAAAASRIRTTLYRVMDQMACLSPERLAVLLPFTDALGADTVAHKIADALRVPAETGELGPRVSLGVWVHACIGAATYAGKGLLPDTHLLECAMAAEATARKKGGDRMARYDPLAANMRGEDTRARPAAVLALPAPSKSERVLNVAAAMGAGIDDFASQESF